MINRSMPPGTVIPEIAYPDVRAAVTWLCAAFGFVERLRIGDHRAQLTIGDGAIVVVGLDPEAEGAGRARTMVKVRQIDAHCDVARRHGAVISGQPVTQVYGERQYTATDPAGHRWTFSEGVADVSPDTWGGTLLTV